MPSIKIIAAFAVLVGAITPATAQDWPIRPVTMVYPFAAGSAAAVFLIGDEADGVSADFCVGGDECETVFCFVFLQRILIDDAGEHIPHIVFAAAVARDEVVKAVGGGRG